ncbi:MAG TPA: hypothetical protein PLA54_08655 [Spirochaetota bacterium]|nr:hypothetical protein [Spirochaetota bacterium]HQE59246.1 hypothetical protein [Spirochaetota bacterium]
MKMIVYVIFLIMPLFLLAKHPVDSFITEEEWEIPSEAYIYSIDLGSGEQKRIRFTFYRNTNIWWYQESIFTNGVLQYKIETRYSETIKGKIESKTYYKGDVFWNHWEYDTDGNIKKYYTMDFPEKKDAINKIIKQNKIKSISWLEEYFAKTTYYNNNKKIIEKYARNSDVYFIKIYNYNTGKIVKTVSFLEEKNGYVKWEDIKDQYLNNVQ